VCGAPGQDRKFYTVTKHGLYGAPAGAIKVNSKGKVTHTDACPCGRRFVDTVSRQDARPMRYAAPGKVRGEPAPPGPGISQGALFDESGLGQLRSESS
jgi:hypothetical protein